MGKTAPTQEQIDALVDAMCMVLNDMGDDDFSVCPYVKAKARVAFHPFEMGDDGDLMELGRAHDIIIAADKANR